MVGTFQVPNIVLGNNITAAIKTDQTLALHAVFLLLEETENEWR